MPLGVGHTGLIFLKLKNSQFSRYSAETVGKLRTRQDRLCGVGGGGGGHWGGQGVRQLLGTPGSMALKARAIPGNPAST